ncbi:hypothetical protein [Microcoleus sp. LEGE 07076]
MRTTQIRLCWRLANSARKAAPVKPEAPVIKVARNKLGYLRWI